MTSRTSSSPYACTEHQTRAARHPHNSSPNCRLIPRYPSSRWRGGKTENFIIIVVVILFSSSRDRYPYFKAEDDRWKNSVRHNLSMNPHFRKGDKSKHGAGHLWVLADYDENAPAEEPVQANVMDLTTGEDASGEEEDEAARAVRSILGQEAANQAAEQAAAVAQAAGVIPSTPSSSRPTRGQRAAARGQAKAARAAEATEDEAAIVRRVLAAEKLKQLREQQRKQQERGSGNKENSGKSSVSDGV